MLILGGDRLIMGKPKSDYSIQTVSNALRMLEAFNDDDELGVSELSRRLGLHKNNVFRLLATLEQSGYIEQRADNELYRLGTACLELGHAFARRHTLMRRARPILEELVRKIGETAHVAILRDHEVVHLDGILPDQRVLTALRVGERLPAHCTALGKVLLGFGDQQSRDAYDHAVISGGGLVASTDATIVDSKGFFDQLQRVADQGYAVDQQECESGMSCVATPVADASGAIVAALSISGPSFRMSPEIVEGEHMRAVSGAAVQLSQELGHTL